MITAIQMNEPTVNRALVIQHPPERLNLHLRFPDPASGELAQFIPSQLSLQRGEHRRQFTRHGHARLGLDLFHQRVLWLAFVTLDADHGDEAVGLVEGVDLAFVLFGKDEPVSVPAEEGGFDSTYDVSVFVGVLHLFGHASAEGVVVVVRAACFGVGVEGELGQAVVAVVDVLVGFVAFGLELAFEVAPLVVVVVVLAVVQDAVVDPAVCLWGDVTRVVGAQQVELGVVDALAYRVFPMFWGGGNLLVFEQAVACGVEAVVLGVDARLSGFDESSRFVVSVLMWALGGVDARELA